MYQHANVLGLILARGSSKSIPRKNIRPLGGKPLLAWTVERAKASRVIDRLILSTDDQEIAEVGKRLGAEVPFLRPAELAGDDTPDYPVFVHALEWLAANETWKPDYIIHLRPTHPFRKTEHIDRAIGLLGTHPEADSVWTVGQPPVTPYKAFRIDEEGFLAPLLTIPGERETYNLPRQKLPPAWQHYGQVDATRYRTVMEKHSLSGQRILPILLEGDIIDLDTPLDWEFAEFLIQRGKQL